MELRGGELEAGRKKIRGLLPLQRYVSVTSDKSHATLLLRTVSMVVVDEGEEESRAGRQKAEPRAEPAGRRASRGVGAWLRVRYRKKIHAFIGAKCQSIPVLHH